MENQPKNEDLEGATLKPKTLDVVDSKDLINKVPDVVVIGNPDTWLLIAKASSKSQGWMKSTKAMEILGLGVVIQVTTENANGVAEALTFVPGACIKSKVVNQETGELVRAVVFGNNLSLSLS